MEDGLKEKDLNHFGKSYSKLNEENSARLKQNIIDIINNTPNFIILIFGACILFLAMITLYTWSKTLLSKWIINNNNKNVTSWTTSNRYQYQSIN